MEARTSSHRALLALRGRLDLINAAAGLGLGDSGDEDEAGDWRKPGVEVDEAGDRALAWAEAALGTKVGMGDSGSDDTGADGDSDSGSDGLGGEEGGWTVTMTTTSEESLLIHQKYAKNENTASH